MKRASLPLGDSFSYRDSQAALSDLQPDTYLKEVVAVSDKYSSAADRAFAKCVSLRRATLAQVSSVGAYAFIGDKLLADAALPNAVAVGSCAFGDCTALSSLNAPSLTALSWAGLSNCKSLSSIALPAVKSFGSQAFMKCTSLLCVDMSGLPAGQVPTAASNMMFQVGHAVSCFVPEGQAESWRAVSEWAALEQSGAVVLVD